MLENKKTSFGKVTICIPTMLDSRYLIELCIKSIRKNTDYPEYRIIVCDSGADEATRGYLNELVEQKQIGMIQASDWERPKDDLAGAVDTEYYVLMHDDIQILKSNWLTRRMELMAQDEKNAIVGSIVNNYNNTRRFFPLGMLVKTEASRRLGLKWGKQPEQGYDTGALAYIKFFSQNEYKFVNYKVSQDIHHFSEMTWPKYKDETFPNIGKLLDNREKKMAMIRHILETNNY